MIWLILASGLIFRLISLNQSLWLDEAINILAAKNYSFFGMITQYARADFHPPGYFVIIWVWGRIFGFSEISMRMPSVIFGLLTIWLIYLIGKKLVSQKLGLLFALFLSINPLHIYYSQEARMYSMAAFAVSLNMLFFIKFVKGDKGKRESGFIYILANLLVLAVDYVAYLIFAAQFIFLLATKQLKNLKKWMRYLFIGGLGFIVWLPIFINQLTIGSNTSLNIPAWKSVVGSFDLKQLVLTYVKFIIGRISYPDQEIYALLFLPAGLMFFIIILRAFWFSEKFVRNLLVSWLIIPIIIASLISLFLPVYSYFRLLFVLPAFVILVSLGILFLNQKIIQLTFMTIILIEVFCSSVYLFSPNFQREDWRGLVAFLKNKSNNEKILFESSGNFSPFEYYAGNSFTGIGALKNFPAKDLTDLIDLKSALKESADVYLINYLVEISDPNKLVQKQLTLLGYKQIEIKNFNGVGFVYHFAKYE